MAQVILLEALIRIPHERVAVFFKLCEIQVCILRKTLLPKFEHLTHLAALLNKKIVMKDLHESKVGAAVLLPPQWNF